eukprot:6666590-Alexandrium_andersonii.AAC.1
MVDPTTPDIASKRLPFAGTVIACGSGDPVAKKYKTRIRIGEHSGLNLFLIPSPGAQSPSSPFF